MRERLGLGTRILLGTEGFEPLRWAGDQPGSTDLIFISGFGTYRRFETEFRGSALRNGAAERDSAGSCGEVELVGGANGTQTGYRLDHRYGPRCELVLSACYESTATLLTSRNRPPIWSSSRPSCFVPNSLVECKWCRRDRSSNIIAQ